MALEGVVNENNINEIQDLLIALDEKTETNTKLAHIPILGLANSSSNISEETFDPEFLILLLKGDDLVNVLLIYQAMNDLNVKILSANIENSLRMEIVKQAR